MDGLINRNLLREVYFFVRLSTYAAHDLQLRYLGIDPSYDGLRSEPRFQDLRVDVYPFNATYLSIMGRYEEAIAEAKLVREHGHWSESEVHLGQLKTLF